MSNRYRVYPSDEQARVLVRHCDDARFVYNLALEQMNMFRLGRPVDMGTWNRQLAEARREFRWLAEGSSSVQQGALQDLRQAFFAWWKNPTRLGHPTWRTRTGTTQGFFVRDLHVRVLNGRWAMIFLPKCGEVRFRLSRPIPLESKSARVTLDRSGRWHVSFRAPQPAVPRVSTGRSIGIDLGIACPVAMSDGEVIVRSALLSVGEAQRKRRLERRFSRQVAGSRRRERNRQKIARIVARETDRRRDWIEKATTRIVRDFDLVAIEDLKIRSMVKSASGTVLDPGRCVAQKRGLNRSISNQAWGLFRRRLVEKASASEVDVVVVSARNTSRRCGACGHTVKENRESQAVFICQSCGHQANADVNAAVNILAAGMAVAGRGGTSLKRPVEASTGMVAA